jgi:two-component system, OmpR family, sensor histidine kinase KdpD
MAVRGAWVSRAGLRRELPAPRSLGVDAVEIVVAVGLATAAIALLKPTAPATGLGVLYLLAVLAIAIRRGQIAALVTAVLSVLVYEFLFIPPVHELAIRHSENVVELIVLMIAAIVVGRLAAASRERAAEAESRAWEAAAREREATLLADVASAILVGQSISAQLESIGNRVAGAIGASRARVVLESAPSAGEGEISLPLRTRTRNAWLYATGDTAWSAQDLTRIAQPLGRLIDVAVERERVAGRAAEAEASKRAEIARTAILHAISHDLRSPLTAITTAGSALRSAGVTSSEREELLDVIEDESVRLARLVDDLLDLSKIEAGAVAPRADWCDLHDVVASAVANLRTDHPIHFVLPPDLPLVRADATQLERVFSNLLANAVKFSPPGAPVTIRAGVGSGRVTVRVIDRGRGIPAHHRPHVFEPFFRGRGEAGAGSGLGLAIAQGFVDANGGTISLQTGGDRGTSFAVSFPVVPQPETVG